MVAPKLADFAELGCHHPLLNPRTITGIIRTTTLRTLSDTGRSQLARSLVMATVNIAIAMKIAG
jgi:hypothetical protein